MHKMHLIKLEELNDWVERLASPGKVVIYRQGSKAPTQVKDDLNTELYLKSADYYLNLMLAAAETFCSNIENGVAKNESI